MAVNEDKIRDLKDRARRMRIDILKMLHGSGSGHTGGSLSATDIMAALYFYKMKYDPKKPGMGFFERLLPARDYRDWEAIRAWASALPAQIQRAEMLQLA